MEAKKSKESKTFKDQLNKSALRMKFTLVLLVLMAFCLMGMEAKKRKESEKSKETKESKESKAPESSESGGNRRSKKVKEAEEDKSSGSGSSSGGSSSGSEETKNRYMGMMGGRRGGGLQQRLRGNQEQIHGHDGRPQGRRVWRRRAGLRTLGRSGILAHERKKIGKYLFPHLFMQLSHLF